MSNAYAFYRLRDLAVAVREELAPGTVNTELASHCKRMVMYTSESTYVAKEASLYPPGAGEAIAAEDYRTVSSYARNAPN